MQYHCLHWRTWSIFTLWTRQYCESVLHYVLGVQVWDLEEGCLLFESHILAAAHPNSLAVDPSYPRLALGQTDGVVRFFDLASLPACRSLYTLDLGQDLQQLVSHAETAVAAAVKAGEQSGAARPRVIRSIGKQQQPQQQVRPARTRWQQGLGGDGGCSPGNLESSRTISSSITSLYYSRLIPSVAAPDDAERSYLTREGPEDGLATGLLVPQPLLLVGTPRGLVVVDSHSYEVVQAWLVGEDAEQCRDIER